MGETENVNPLLRRGDALVPDLFGQQFSCDWTWSGHMWHPETLIFFQVYNSVSLKQNLGFHLSRFYSGTWQNISEHSSEHLCDGLLPLRSQAPHPWTQVPRTYRRRHLEFGLSPPWPESKEIMKSIDLIYTVHRFLNSSFDSPQMQPNQKEPLTVPFSRWISRMWKSLSSVVDFNSLSLVGPRRNLFIRQNWALILQAWHLLCKRTGLHFKMKNNNNN